MKKTSLLLSSLACILLLVACDFNAPLRNKMINYYAQDDVYYELQGQIASIEYNKDTDILFLEIDLESNNYDFPINAETEYCEFNIVNWSAYEFNLKTNDVVVFWSAPMRFYNGHRPPIVGLRKNDVQYISLEDGKDNYINWIKEKFD